MSRRWWRVTGIGYALSFCFFAGLPLFRATNPRHVPSNLDFTDHEAHWGSALLLAFHGFDVYRVPVDQLCERAPETDPGVGNAIPCRMPDHPSIRTFAENWTGYPRVYPPGAMLFAAPAAFLYALTPISFGGANLVSILESMAVAHLASLLLLLALWRTPSPVAEGELVTTRDWNLAVVFLLLPVFHLTLVCWGAVGIYDSAPVLCVIAGILLLARERAPEATLAFSAAIFLHFRGLWYLPLLAVALHRTLVAPLGRRVIILLAISAALLVPTAEAFALLWPTLKTFPTKSPVLIDDLLRNPDDMLTKLLPFALVVAFLCAIRSWRTAGVVSWQLFMLVQTREMRTWHMLFTWPFLVVASQERRSAILAVLAAFLLVVAEAHIAFSTWPLSGQFLAMFFHS